MYDEALRLDSVSYRAGEPGGLDSVSAAVATGALLAVLGPAGSGKSALINILAGLNTGYSGDTLLAGNPLRRLPTHRRGFGLVMQNDALFPHLSLAENVAYPLRLRGVPSRERTSLVETALESVLLENAGRRPHRATAAERQRAALARATVFGPRLLLLDEPLSDQPAETRPALVAAIRRLHLMLGTTTVLATRVAADALALGDEVAVLHQGRVEQQAAPQRVYDFPVSAAAALACGEANLLPGTVHEIDQDGMARVGLDCGPTVEGTAAETLRVRNRCLYCLRPERIAVVPASAADMGDASEARVLDVLMLGDSARLRLLLGDGAALLVKRPVAAGMRGLTSGAAVAVAWQPGNAWVFPKS
jgi:putative spermidine/putrescine transport system ATP-binding protein